MGWKEFWASVIASVVTLGWPLIALTIVIILVSVFRKEIAALSSRLTKAKLAGFEGEFADRVADVEQSAEEVVAEADVPPGEPTPRRRTVEPVAAILRRGEDVSQRIADLYEVTWPRAGWPPLKSNRDGAAHVYGSPLFKLRDAGLISARALSVIEELRQLRNAVAHGRVLPDREQADQFLDAAEDMERYLTAITRKVEGGVFDAALASE
jgi:hypothetical protein